MAKYFAQIKSQIHGPLSSKELRSLAESGELLPPDFVWKEGSTQKVKAKNVKGPNPLVVQGVSGMQNRKHSILRSLTIFAIQFGVIFNAYVAGVMPVLSNDAVTIGSSAAYACEVASVESSESFKVISVEFDFSATVNRIWEGGPSTGKYVSPPLASVKYSIEPPSAWRLEKWSPRNSSEKKTLGPVNVNKKKGETTNFGASADAGASADVEASGGVGVAGGKAGVGAKVNGGIRYDNRKEDVEETEYDLPAETIIAINSGPHGDGNGVFFELKKTRQHRTEGNFKCKCHFEVAHDWRGDHVMFRATSTLENGDPHTTSRLIWLYLKGDDEARTFSSKSGDLRSRINEKAAKVKKIEEYFSYPYFGYGSQAEKIRKEKRSLEKELKDLKAKFLGKSSE